MTYARATVTGVVLLALGSLAQTGKADDLRVTTRPFAVSKTTMEMCADGWFDVANDVQYIGLYVKNAGSADKTNVSLSLSVPSGVTLLEPPTQVLGTLTAGGEPTLVLYKASFKDAAVGKPDVTASFTHDGGTESDQWNIFIAKSGFVSSGNRHVFLIDTPEANVTTEVVAHQGENDWSMVGLPTSLTYSVRYKTPFDGQHGPIAYNDPFWKTAGLVTTCFFGGMGTVVGAARVIRGKKASGTVIAASSMCAHRVAWGLATAGKDVIDPIRRGQNLTVPATGELTELERASLSVDWDSGAEVGTQLGASVTWRYTRVTDANIYSHQLTE